MKFKPSLRLLHITTISLLSLPSIVAQTDDRTNPAPSQTEVDRSWAELQIARQPRPNAAEYQGKTAAERELVKKTEAERFIGLADKLKKFAEDHPNAPQAKEAKRLEALNLIYATQAGEHSNDGRWKSILNELRRDTSIPAKDRYQLAAMASHANIARQVNLSRTERLDAYYEAAQGLAAEFPSENETYQALLGIARNSSNDRALKLCQQIMAGPADATTKLAAKALAGRLNLVGTELAAVLEPTGVKVELSKGKPVVIYSWATWSEGSQAQALALVGKTGQATVVGLCLDNDVAAAKELAAIKKLPGEVFYDDRGTEGSLSQALHLGDVGWIYYVDAKGVITDIRAQENIDQLNQG